MKMELSYFSSAVEAGFPSPAMDYMEERIDLNKVIVKHPLATFIVSVEGDSMINAFIPPGARLVVDRSISAKNGDIVLAVLNGEFTVKFLKKNEYKCWLIPANRKYQDIEITGESNLQVWGVVIHVLIDTSNLRRCML
ncbi:MAG: translesion error-prone DNA polymerase V autoproteolytic subunit [Chitinophagaceae bacterium]|nr:translesion error-prone DNA polymerase V autoproteolytic subunit [Chitinophagaceae bacterium]